MNTISIINLKGGVAKTITAINMAYILAVQENKRVLLIDNDKQGNTTKFFGLHDEEQPSIAEVLTEKNYNIRQAIRATKFNNLYMLPADMRLLSANKTIMLDMTRQQQVILRDALAAVQKDFDYCIIDNAPDINISTINALVAADEIIIPVKIDKFTLDGVDELASCFEEMKVFNTRLSFLGVLITMYTNTTVNREGAEWLQTKSGYPMFKTKISRSTKIDESTFLNKPLILHSKRCTASKDYIAFVQEYLQKSVSNLDTKRGNNNA